MILATSAKTVKISENSASYGSASYTKCIDLSGGADGVLPTYRAVKVALSAGQTLKVVANASADRTLQISDGSSVVASAAVSSDVSETSYTASSSGTYYVYSKSSSLRLFEVSVSSAESSFEAVSLNADSLAHGTFTANVTIYATSAKTVTVPYISASLNGTTFTQTIALGGGGSAGAYRCVGFKAASGCTVTAYAYGASGRYLALVDSTGAVVSKSEVTSSLAEYTFSVPSDGSYYLMSTASGINVCYINVAK